eukprot:9968557-Karenia_brevis.AAC.1
MDMWADGEVPPRDQLQCSNFGVRAARPASARAQREDFQCGDRAATMDMPVGTDMSRAAGSVGHVVSM